MPAPALKKMGVRLAFPAALMLGVLVLFPGLGDFGLWDPWEMNPSHLARSAASKPLVLVAAHRSALSEFPELLSLKDQSPHVVPHWLNQKVGPRAGRAHLKARLAQARAQVKEQNYHAVVVPLGRKYTGAPAVNEEGWRDFQTQIRTKLPGSRLIIVGAEASALALKVQDAHQDLHFVQTKRQFDAAISALGSMPPLLLRTESGKGVYGQPVLRYWLAALSYRFFGFNELGARFPNAMLGLLTLVLVFAITLRLAGPWEAFLAVAVLVGTPYLPVQARSAGGEMGFVAYFTVALFGLLQTTFGRWRLGTLIYGVGFLLLFLEKGLYGPGLLTLVSVAGALFYVERKRTFMMLALGSILGVAVLAWLVLGPDNWTFFSHFRAMGHPFEGGVGKGDRSFDYLLLQLGFGFFPWSVLLPFALAWVLVRWLSDDSKEDKICGLIILWATVPLVAMAATQLHFAHFVYPAGPALAISIAIFASHMREEERPWPLRVLFLTLALYLLISEIKLSPHALVGTVTWDPPFVFAFREIHEGVLYPEMVEMARSYRLLGFLFCFWIAYSGLRGGMYLRQVYLGSADPRVFFGGTAAILGAGFLWLTLSLGLQIQTMVLSSGGAITRRHLYFLNRHCWARPEHWFLYLSILWFVAAGVLDLIAAKKESAPEGGAKPGTPIPRGLGWLSLAPLAKGAPRPKLSTRRGWLLSILSVLGGAALLGTSVHAGESLAPMWAGFMHPAFVFVFLCVGFLFFLFRPLASGPIAAGLGAAVFLFWGILASRSVDVITPVTTLAILIPSFGWLLYLGQSIRFSKELARVGYLGLIAALGFALLAPILMRHQAIIPKSTLPGAEDFAAVLFSVAPGTVFFLFFLSIWVSSGWARALPAAEAKWGPAKLHASIVAVVLGSVALIWGAAVGSAAENMGGVLKVIACMPLWGLFVHGVALLWLRWPGAQIGVRWGLRAAMYLERPQVLVPGLVLVSLLLTAQLVHGFVPELSLHVSQKHILDRYRAATASGADHASIFRYGQFSASARGDRNFYVQSIPDVSSQATVLQVLGAKKDVPVNLTESPFLDLPEHQVFRVYSRENDQNDDDQRDWEADSGVAQKVGLGTLFDERKNWKVDMWKGAQLFDGSGAAFAVTGNSADKIHFSVPTGGKTKAFGARATEPKNFYILDHPEALNHQATAAQPTRAFVILPKSEFSGVNYKFRKKNGGRSIPVIDDRSSNLMLVSSGLGEDEIDRNWITEHLAAEGSYEGAEGFQAARVNFNDKLQVEGMRVWQKVYRRGKKLKLSFYYRVLGAVKRSYKVFVHVDKKGGANRIGGDHWVLNLSGNEKEKNCVGCFRTDHWMVGDIVVDTFEAEIPVGAGIGPHDVWMGFYEPGGGKRLKVKDFDKEKVKHDGGDRVKIGSITVM